MSEPRVVQPTAQCLRQVAAALLEGELAVIPTDTVYGLAARPTAECVRRLFEAKGRPETRAIPLLLSGASALTQVAAAWPGPAKVLTRHFWPGALTVIVAARDTVAEEITAGTGTVGVRVPAHDVARSLIAMAGGVLAVTSANRSGRVAASSVSAAMAALSPHVAWYVDGGALTGGLPSTVVEVRDGSVRVLRQGAIEPDTLRRVLDGESDEVEFIAYGGD